MEWKNKKMIRRGEDREAWINNTGRKKFAWFPVTCKESESWVWLEWYWYLTYQSNLGDFVKIPTRPVRKERDDD